MFGIDKKMKPLINASTVGMSMVAAVAIGTFMGYYIDKYFDTKPIFTIIFMICGVIAAFKNLFYFVKRAEVLEDEE